MRFRTWLLAIVVCAASSSACIPGELDLEPEQADAGDAGSHEASRPDVTAPDGRADAAPDVARDTSFPPDAPEPEAPLGDRTGDDVAPEREGSIGTMEAGDVARDAREGGRDVGAPDVVCLLACCPSCLGKACGDTDGCAGICLNGYCPPPQTCGGGGMQGKCGCRADCSGKVCGDPDGCGGTCTYCNPPDTCGAITPNVCGCRRVCQNQPCGASDACTGRCSNGFCTKPFDTCGGGGRANECGCTPNCAGKNCGDDGCGGDCGGCPTGQTCGGGGDPNHCGCSGSCSPGEKVTCATGCRVGLNCSTCAAILIQSTCTDGCMLGVCEFPSACAACGNSTC